MYNKTIVAVLGAVSAAVAQGLLPDDVAPWVAIVISFLTALGVFQVPNVPEPHVRGRNKEK
jgi:hypothetical protein